MSQIETLMIFGLGAAMTFVVVMLFGRFFWGMAVTAAARRRERLAPVEVLDAQAERDKLRAEHALMSRKLDLRLEDIKVRMAEQMAEVSRNRNRVQGLVEEVEKRDETLRQRDQHIAGLQAQLERQRAEIAAAHKTIEGLNHDAARSETEMSRLQQSYHELGQSLRERHQAMADLSDGLRDVAAMQPQERADHTEATLRQRVARISAASQEMAQNALPRFEPAPHNSHESIFTPQSNHAVAAHMPPQELAHELKSLDDMLEQNRAPAPEPRRRFGSGNVISLAQRIRALQKGMGE